MSLSVLALLACVLGGCGSTASGRGADGLGTGDVSLYLLRSQNREAQRVIADLQTQLDESRRILAASQVTRARLQGRVRELERQCDEAHQVVDLQREELARLRDEREEVLRTSRQIQVQLTRLRRRLSALSPGGMRHAQGPADGAEGDETTVLPVADTGGPAPTLNGMGRDGERPAIVVVRRGDSLWKIARRYDVSVAALRTLNGLDDNPDLIFPGQELVLPQ